MLDVACLQTLLAFQILDLFPQRLCFRGESRVESNVTIALGLESPRYLYLMLLLPFLQWRSLEQAKHDVVPRCD